MLMRPLATLAALSCAAIVAAQAPELRFNDEGEFKIVQFTDNHYKKGKKASLTTIEAMNAVLDAEQPDLVVFTGDLVYDKDVAEEVDSALVPVLSRGLPFAFVFGNHDTEFDLGYSEIYDILQAKPGSVMLPRIHTESPDYCIDILDGDSISAVLYCLDSHRTTKVKDAGKYDWLKLTQIQWYKEQSDRYTSFNGGKPMPALMFFHIPLPEIDYAHADGKSFILGTKGEDVCSPKLNSGMFAAVKEKGDVRGIFFGHDHDNDYIANYYGVVLGYGRYTGGNTVYNHIGTNGGRVIVLHRNGDLETWIRLRTGEVINPYSTAKKKKNRFLSF